MIIVKGDTFQRGNIADIYVKVEYDIESNQTSIETKIKSENSKKAKSKKEYEEGNLEKNYEDYYTKKDGWITCSNEEFNSI